MLLITSLRHWRRQDFGKPNWCNTIRFSKSVIEISQRCLLLAKFSLKIETPNGAGSHFRAKLEYSVVLSLGSLGLHCLLECVCWWLLTCTTMQEKVLFLVFIPHGRTWLCGFCLAFSSIKVNFCSVTWSMQQRGILVWRWCKQWK